MKKFLIAAVVMVFVFNSSKAQRQHELQILIKPMLTSLRGNEAVRHNFDPAFNFSTGVSLSYPVGKMSFINVGFQYAKKGGRGSGSFYMIDDALDVFDGNIKYRYNFHYLVLPAEYRIRIGDKIAGEFGLGFYVAALLKAQSKAKLSDGRKEKEDIINDYKRFDMGLSATAKVIFPLGSKANLGLGLNNQLGLFNISDRPVRNDGSIKHNGLGLLIEFAFKL